MQSAYRPETLEDALICRRDTHARPYAGGTDLMPQGRRWMGVRPRFKTAIMFIGHLPDLKDVRQREDDIVIGPGCTLARLAAEGAVPDALRRIAAAMASPGVRNLATIGGNICNASPAADTLPYLYAVDARLVLRSAGDRRETPVADFFQGPGMTTLAEDEILTEIIVPAAAWEVCDYHKVAARRANAPSKISFLGIARRNGLGFKDLRLAFGAVGPTVVRSRDLERGLLAAVNTAANGKQNPEKLADCVESFGRIIHPIDDQRASAVYRRQVALNLLQNFIDGLSHSSDRQNIVLKGP